MTDLFSYADAYPVRAGFKGSAETSRAAAESVNASTLRGQVLRWLQLRGSATADECATCLRLTPFSVRPRFTELARLGKVRDTGLRRKNASGRNAIVWQAAP